MEDDDGTWVVDVFVDVEALTTAHAACTGETPCEREEELPLLVIASIKTGVVTMLNTTLLMLRWICDCWSSKARQSKNDSIPALLAAY